MNRNFICVKVDREERPDLDELLMTAAVSMTGHGGWPLNVFLTPALKPFFAGTYFPPESRHGMPSFRQVLESIAHFWEKDRATILRGAEAVEEALRVAAKPEQGTEGFAPPILEAAARRLLGALDPVCAGFGLAPKFPQPAFLLFLLEEAARSGNAEALAAAEATLRAMAAGGLQDQLAGGFHRYAVDRAWRVPHFEKMLTDNALLALAYLRAWQITGREEHAAIARRTLDFLLREFQDPLGGFHSALDADSDHEEGAYYRWSRREIAEEIGEELAGIFCRVHGLSDEGPAAGILCRAESAARLAEGAGRPLGDLLRRLNEARGKLLEKRGKRTRPAADRKLVTAWNGLAISVFALAGAALDHPEYGKAARRAADRLLREHSLGRGLIRYSIDLAPFGRAFLDDHAFFVLGLLDLHAATQERRYLSAAVRLGHDLLDRFATAGSFAYAEPAAGAEASLPPGPPPLRDGAAPCAAAAAWDALRRLSLLTGETRFAAAADGLESDLAAQARRSPEGAAYALAVAASALAGETTVAVFGPTDAASTRALLKAASRHLGRGLHLFAVSPEDETPPPPFAAGKGLHAGRPAAWVCHNRACLPPAGSAKELRSLLDTHKWAGTVMPAPENEKGGAP